MDNLFSTVWMPCYFDKHCWKCDLNFAGYNDITVPDNYLNEQHATNATMIVPVNNIWPDKLKQLIIAKKLERYIPVVFIKNIDIKNE